MQELIMEHQSDLDMLNNNSSMPIPKTINTYEDPEENSRAQQVISPDGTGTFDGTSTIGSTTSEPTTETASRASQSIVSRKSKTAGGGASGTRKKRSTRNTPSQNGSSSGGRPSSRNNGGGNNYRSANYGSSSRHHQASSSRQYKRPGPLSYSRTVKLSGTGSPYSGREVDDKTRAVLADMNEFDANQAETENIAADIFAPGTGISDDEIRKIMRVRVSSKQMELDQQVAAGNKVIKRLKDTLTAITKGKNEFLHRAISSEKQARSGWAQALETAQLLDEDRGFFKQKVKQLEVDNTIWKDNAKDTMRELSLSEDKMQNLRNEIEEIKEKLHEAENAGTQALIALEVEKARNQENEKQQQGWRQTQEAMQNESARALERNRNDQELRNLVKAETSELKEELQERVARIKELENELVLAESQFARAVADSDSAEQRARSKDKDMTELMKSIGEMQATSKAREEEANTQRREAEKKVSALEQSVAVTKGELNVFNHERSTLKDTLDTAKSERLAALKSLDDMKDQVDKLKTDFNATKSQLTLEKELRSRSEQKEREERNERIALSAQMVAMTKDHARMESSITEAKEADEGKWQKEFEKQEEKLKEKEAELEEAGQKIAGLTGEIEALKSALQSEKSSAVAENAEEMSKLKAEIHILHSKLQADAMKNQASGMATQQKVDKLEQQLREGQAERRKMHNTIQELRGNVRVFARIRPYLPGDGVDDDTDAFVFPKSETSLRLLDENSHAKKYDFSFDRVFGPSTGQEAVFTEVSEFVQSALDGYNVCLFSYGQTGSGKTHTMQGSGVGQMRGIIPRAIEQVGEYKTELERDGWQYDMQVSFVEIYNETIRDLLRDEEFDDSKHDIKIGQDGRRFVSGINMVPLEPTDSDAVEDIMRQAAKYRSVGSTSMNAVSSRSHSVFTLHLTALNPLTRQAIRGTLNLCDLAGSERLSRSEATGARAKEAMAINKSLSSLTDVFVAIGKKQSHIPFRNSKLTRLLEPSLSGDGKTLMLVNLSPTELSTQESVCSLRFAAQVNKCELGKAKRSLEEVDEDDAASISSSMSGHASRAASVSAKKGPTMKSPPGRTKSKVGGGRTPASSTRRR